MARSTPRTEYPPENDEERRRRRRRLAQTLAVGGMDDVHVLSHESADEILTPRRRELIHTLNQTEVDSVRELASLVERDHGQVSRDLQTLAEHGIVEFEQSGRAKRPSLQHAHVVIEPVV